MDLRLLVGSSLDLKGAWPQLSLSQPAQCETTLHLTC